MAGLLVLIIAISAPFAQLSDAEKLTAIAAPSISEHESTQRRFEFLVKEFNKYCPAVHPQRICLYSHTANSKTLGLIVKKVCSLWRTPFTG